MFLCSLKKKHKAHVSSLYEVLTQYRLVRYTKGAFNYAIFFGIHKDILISGERRIINKL